MHQSNERGNIFTSHICSMSESNVFTTICHSVHDRGVGQKYYREPTLLYPQPGMVVEHSSKWIRQEGKSLLPGTWNGNWIIVEMA